MAAVTRLALNATMRPPYGSFAGKVPYVPSLLTVIDALGISNFTTPALGTSDFQTPALGVSEFTTPDSGETDL